MANGVVAPGAIPTTHTLKGSRAAILRTVAGDRWARVGRWLTWGAFGLVLTLAALAPIARTGDAHQYYAMATALADARAPALTGDEVARFKAWLQAQPADSGFASSVRAVDQPPLVVAGRQEFSHFWVYPLLAAPVIRIMSAVDLHPGYGFLAVNAALLAVALWQVQRAYSAVVSLLILASPLIWFVNKAQVEVFTFSLLAIAMAQAGRGRWLGAGLAAAIASTQNAPLLAAVACFWGAGLLQQVLNQRRFNPCPEGAHPNLGGTHAPASSGFRITPRAILLVALTAAIGALHPAYYQWRLGVLTPQRLNGGIDLGLPSPERYFSVLLDPDIGLLPWLPLTGLLALLGLVLLWWPTSSPPAPQTWGKNGRTSRRPWLVAGSARSVGEPHCPRAPTPVVRGTTTGVLPTAIVEPRSTGAASGSPTERVTPPKGAHVEAPPRAGEPGGRSRRLAALCGLVIGAWLLFVFAQSTNVNSGGTVHISRYALWLLPLGVPLLAATADWLHPRLPGLLPVAGSLALLVYATAFHPARPEQYVTQSPQAAFVTTWLPELYRTVPEIFYERQVQRDGGVRGSAATASCRVVLLYAEARALPCALNAREAAAADKLFASGWEAAWIIRPGPLGLGGGGVAGALPQP